MSTEIRQIVQVVEKLETRKSEKLRPKSKVNHMNTGTTKNTMLIVEQMNKSLEQIAGEITNRHDRGVSLDKIRKSLSEKVGSIIANGIRESYLLGLHFVEQFAERTLPLTTEQTNELNNQIKTTIASFWSSVEKTISDDEEKKKAKILGAALPLDSSLFKKLTELFSKNSTTMNFLALGNSTVSTFKTYAKFGVDDLGIQVTGEIEVPKLAWISERDNRVCPICQALDGKEWFADDGNIPRPGPDSHFGCRCRLLPKSNGKIFNA